MNIILIAAIDRTNAIAKNGAIPWKLKDDLALFKKKTMGHFLLTGRKTYDSIGHSLVGRTMLILTNQENFKTQDGIIFHSIEKAITYAKEQGETDLFVIGGAEIYVQTMPLATHLYLSFVDTIIQGDIFFPDINFSEWEKTSTKFTLADNQNEHSFIYCEYKNK